MTVPSPESPAQTPYLSPMETDTEEEGGCGAGALPGSSCGASSLRWGPVAASAATAACSCLLPLDAGPNADLGSQHPPALFYCPITDGRRMSPLALASDAEPSSAAGSGAGPSALASAPLAVPAPRGGLPPPCLVTAARRHGISWSDGEAGGGGSPCRPTSGAGVAGSSPHTARSPRFSIERDHGYYGELQDSEEEGEGVCGPERRIPRC